MDSGRQWSQSVARRSLMGREKTNNPSPAAAAILRKSFGAKRVKKARSFLGKRRRRFHRGNPVPAALASVLDVQSVLSSIPGLGSLLKKPSDKIAAGIAPGLVAVANAGNLTAARGLIDRAAWPMNLKESAVWKAAAGQLTPKIRAAVRKYADMIPMASQQNPKAFAASLTPAVDLNDIEQEAAAIAVQSKAERAAAAATARAERSQLLGTVADVGVAGLQAFAGRGRRPSTRRRKRRAPARRISL